MTTFLFEPDFKDRVVADNIEPTIEAFANLPDVENLVVIAPEGRRKLLAPLASRFPSLKFFPWEEHNNYALLRAVLAHPSRTYVRVRGAWVADSVQRFVAPALERFKAEGKVVAFYRPELVRLAGIISRSFVEFIDRSVVSRLANAGVKVSPDGLLSEALRRAMQLEPVDYRQDTLEEKLHFFADFSEVYFPYPRVVRISPTNFCNFDCRNCYIYQYKSSGQTRYFAEKIAMDFDLWRHVIDDVASWTTAFNIKMGDIEEPLTHPELPRLVEYAKSRGVSCVYFITNGALLTPRLDEELIAAGLDRIFISLNTDLPEAFQHYVKYDYETICRKVRDLVAARARLGADHPTIFVSVITDWRYVESRLQSAERWLDEVDGVTFTNYIDFRDSDPSRPYFLDYYRDLPPRTCCQDLWGDFIVLPGGEVVPCILRQKMLDGADVTVVGNIRDRSFMDLFHGEAMKALRREQIRGEFNERSPCRNCDFWSMQLYETAFEDATLQVRESAPFTFVMKKPGGGRPNLEYFRNHR